MAEKTFDELLSGAQTIRDNELPESNTHTLVGEQLVNMVEKNKEESGKKLAISDLASGRGESTTTAMTQAAVTQELETQDEKLTELSSDIGKVSLISNIYNKVVFAYKGYIDNTGNIVENDVYRYTDYIQVDGDVSIDYKLFGSSAVRLVEVTDSEGTPLNYVNGKDPTSEAVIGNLSSNTNKIKKVRFCCNVQYLDDVTIKIDSDTNLVSKGKLNETNIRTPIMSVDGDVYKGAAITINTGVINYSADKSYKLMRFYVDAANFYIYTPGSSTQETLWKYADETYSTPEKRIIGKITRDGLFTVKNLKEGYYAFSWNGDENSAFITNELSIIKYLYNKFFDGVDINSILPGYSISSVDGTIRDDVDYAYKIAKMYIPKGRYMICSPGSGSQSQFWKYTDSSFSTPEQDIINTKQKICKEIDLEEGYYVLCWNDGNYDGITMNVISLRRISKIEETIQFIELSNRISFNLDSNGIISPCAITAETGVIRTDVIAMYKAVKFFIKKGLYYISTPGASTQETLWKYTDETYATPEKRIIGKLSRKPDGCNHEYKLFLEEGYYAFSWNDVSTDIQQNAAFIYPIEHLNENGISSFSDFSIKNQSFEISEDKRTAKSLKTGYENRIEYNTPTYEDKFILSACLKAIKVDSSGYFEMCIGKWSWLSGTMFCIGKDSEGGYIGVYRIDDSETPSLTNKYRISEFSVEINTEYNIVIEKTTEAQGSFLITITNSKGITHTQTIAGKVNPDEGEDTGNEGNGSDAGYGWGKVCVYAVLGSFEVSDIYFNYPVNRTNLKLIVSGHSFIEGNSIWQNKDKRFAALLCKDLGLDETIILGQGGATTISILKHIEKQVSWLNTAKYILFCIGTNDTDSEENANKLGEIDSIARKYGLKTIWLTITPRYDLGDNHPIMNAYIKEHFNYININDIFYEDDGVTIRRDMLFPADNVHPTIPAHELIYKVIKAKCSYLYSLK